MTTSTGSSNPAYDLLRAAALRFPEAVEEFPWGHSAIKVRGKAFVFMGAEGGKFGLSCKLPHSHEAALLLPFATPTGYGLGKSGWVSANFEEKDARVPVALLEEWIGESYRAIAPKKLAATLGAVPAGRSEGTGGKNAAKAAAKAKTGAAAKAVPAGRSSGTGAKKAAKAAPTGRSAGTGAKKAAKAAPGGSSGAGAKKAAKAVPAGRSAGTGAKKVSARRAG
jgi:predicted DNA-binding protein (MmcQ/YjbR family)